MLELPQVRTFVAIADEGSFVAAARKLGMSQPAVSQHISKLELELGAQLFRRSRGLCSATTEGEQLLPHARALLAAEQRCRGALAARSLSIAASTNIGTYHLPQLLRRFKSNGDAPDIKVTIGTNLDVYRRVESEEADVGLTEWWDERETLAAVRWHEEELRVIVSPEHPWAGKKRVSPKELLQTPMIGGESGTGTASLLRQMFPEAKDLRVSMTLGSTEAVKQAVMAGLGISLVMSRAVETEVADRRLIALPLSGKKVRKTLFAVFQRGLSEGSLPGKFVSFMRTGRLPD
jgi:DNA-binding transcriptional LysR family regulator